MRSIWSRSHIFMFPSRGMFVVPSLWPWRLCVGTVSSEAVAGCWLLVHGCRLSVVAVAAVAVASAVVAVIAVRSSSMWLAARC